MNRVIPEVGMQVVAQPHTQQFAAPKPSRGFQITQALLGMAQEGVKAYDADQQMKAEGEAARLKSEIEAAAAEDERLLEMPYEQMIKAAGLGERVKAVADFGSRGSVLLRGFSEQWQNASTVAQAKRRKADDLSYRNMGLSNAVLDNGATWGDLGGAIKGVEEAHGLEASIKSAESVLDGFGSRNDLTNLRAMKDDTALPMEVRTKASFRIDQIEAAARREAEAAAKANAKAAQKQHEQAMHLARFRDAVNQNQAPSADDTKAVKEYLIEGAVQAAMVANPSISYDELGRISRQTEDSFHVTYNLPNKGRQDTYNRIINAPYLPDGTVTPQFLSALKEYDQYQAKGVAPLMMDSNTIRYFSRYTNLVQMGQSPEHAARALSAFEARGGQWASIDRGTNAKLQDMASGFKNYGAIASNVMDSYQFYVAVMGKEPSEALDLTKTMLEETHAEIDGQMVPKSVGMTEPRLKAIHAKAVTDGGLALASTDDTYLSFEEAGFHGSAVLMTEQGTPYFTKDGLLVVIPNDEWGTSMYQAEGDVILHEDKQEKAQVRQEKFESYDKDAGEAMVEWAKGMDKPKPLGDSFKQHAESMVNFNIKR